MSVEVDSLLQGALVSLASIGLQVVRVAEGHDGATSGGNVESVKDMLGTMREGRVHYDVVAMADLLGGDCEEVFSQDITLAA